MECSLRDRRRKGTLPQLAIIGLIALGILVIVVRKLQSNHFERALQACGWSELPACPAKVPWTGENRGPVRCFSAELKPGVPCTILVAEYLRPVNTTRRHSVDPILGIYIPKENPAQRRGRPRLEGPRRNPRPHRVYRQGPEPQRRWPRPRLAQPTLRRQSRCPPR